MKNSIPIAFILGGVILLIMPIVHNLVSAEIVASTLIRISGTLPDGSSVSLPPTDIRFFWASIAAGVALEICGVYFAAKGTVQL